MTIFQNNVKLYPYQTNQKIEKKLYTFGFQTYQLAFFRTQDFQNLKNCFINKTNNLEIPTINKCSFNYIKKASHSFIENHANNIDLSIPYLHNENLKNLLIKNFGKNPKNYNQILQFIKPYIENKNVLNIIPTLMPNNFQYGTTKYYYIYGNMPDLNFYKKLKPLLYELILNGPLNQFTIPIYIHELYHALSKRNKGYTKNYLYDEIIPIFMETISSLENNILYETALRRLILTKDNIQDTLTIENQKYIISYLCASELFNIYIQSSNKGQQEINNEINKVLTGRKTLEDILDKYQIPPQKGANTVKKQIKILK